MTFSTKGVLRISVDPASKSLFPIIGLHRTLLCTKDNISSVDTINFVENVMAQVKAKVPAGYSIFNLFARLADKDSKVLSTGKVLKL